MSDGICAINPVLGSPGPSDAWHTRLQVDLFPFRIESGRLQFVDPTEEFFHEAFDPAITRRLRPPVVRCENGGNRDGGDALALRDQVGIVRRLERGSDIVVREFRTELDRQELEACVPFALDEGVDRLRRDEDDSSNLTAPQLLPMATGCGTNILSTAIPRRLKISGPE